MYQRLQNPEVVPFNEISGNQPVLTTDSKYCPWFVLVWTVCRVVTSWVVLVVSGPCILSPWVVFCGQWAVFNHRGSCFVDSRPCLLVRVSENLAR